MIRGWQRAWPLALIALVQIGLALAYLYAGWSPSGPGFPFDDGWIHAVFARNLAHYGAVGFTPGQWTGGTTSLLWVLLLAPGEWLGLPAPVTAALYGTAAWLVAGGCFYALLVEGLGSREAALLWTLLLAALGPLTYLALSGMETALFVALGLLALAAFCRERYGLAGLALALLVVTRVEGLALVVVAAVALLADVRRRGARRAAALLLPPLGALLAYALYNSLVTGSPLPSTMAGRKWLWGLPDRPLALTLPALGNYLDTWRLYLEGWLFHLSALPNALRPAGRVLVWGSLTAGLAVLAGRTIAWLRGRASPALPLILAWALAHNAVYLLLSPFPSLRHQVPNLLLLVLLPAAAWQAAAAWLGARRPALRLLPSGAALLLAVALLPTALDWQRAYADHVGQINAVHVQAGRWIDAHLPSGARVAAFDIGAVTYFGRRETLDLGGLVDAGFAREYLYPGRVPAFLDERQAGYLAMVETNGRVNSLVEKMGLAEPEAIGLSLQPEATFRFEPVVPAPFDALPFYFYLPAYWQMTIYRLEQALP